MARRAENRVLRQGAAQSARGTEGHCGGRRRGGSDRNLADLLWPDEEGDAARKAFDVGLVRLRRLLGSAEAVTVRDEQVALNRDICWVDAWAFARSVERSSVKRELSFYDAPVSKPWVLSAALSCRPTRKTRTLS